MAGDSAIARVWEIAVPLVTAEGMEVVDIELRREGHRGRRVLRLYLDKEGGANLDDLARVSRRIGDLLDQHSAVEGAYVLEVSSPGINRTLKKPEHFARFVGRRIRVRTRETIEGRKSFLGILKQAREGKIAVLQDGKEVHIPFSAIEKANYEHDWST
ncbi:MAG: ribosome maturation factor RimP [Candidatus Binatia bacterium]